MRAASVIFAAGKGTRMTGYHGNKTLLPLIAGQEQFIGSRPLLVEVIENLPRGPKGVVVHHCKEDVIRITQGMDLTYLEQPTTNGTGGALLASRDFLDRVTEDHVIVTMGDVPLVRKETYERLLRSLDKKAMVVLGFRPKNHARYGALEIEADRVIKITEWKYWKDYPQHKQKSLDVFNSGIYAAQRNTLLTYLDILQARPHRVEKELDGRMVLIEEYFITDLVEFMVADGLHVGYITARDEDEVMGVDDPEALRHAQSIYAETSG